MIVKKFKRNLSDRKTNGIERSGMIVLIQATVLTIGLNGKNKILRELPIRLITKQSGNEAACSLKNEKIDSVISKWDLADMEDGRFLRKLRTAKPDIPTIVFVKAGDAAQEIAARSIGVSAILTDNASDELFLETVTDVLGLKGTVSIKAIAPIKEKKSWYKIKRMPAY